MQADYIEKLKNTETYKPSAATLEARKLFPDRETAPKISYKTMAERDPKGELILMSCLGYVFEIKQEKFRNFHERMNIGKDLTRGLLMWYRGGYPDHS